MENKNFSCLETLIYAIGIICAIVEFYFIGMCHIENPTMCWFLLPGLGVLIYHYAK